MAVFKLKTKRMLTSSKNSQWKVPAGMEFQVVSKSSSFPNADELKTEISKIVGFELGNISLGSNDFETISKS
jgi:hypothetical protein